MVSVVVLQTWLLAMLAQMADQEREAVLGRMAATLAHEVRNPLAGMLTAIRTLRRFGDRADARAEHLSRRS